MEKLHEKFTDPNSRQVLTVLQESIANAGRNSLLQKLSAGSLSLRAFGFAAKVRLDAATKFVPFLSATEEKLKKDGEWNEMTSALRGNLNEELGLVHEKYESEADHDIWRSRFRSGLERALYEEGIALQEIDDRDTTHEIGVLYGDKLRTMPTEKSPASLAGAFTVLEGILEKEFSAILAYIDHRLKSLTNPELLYVRHHASHEHRHLKEATIPLLKKCRTSPHIVPDVISGIQEMEKMRLQEVLERIEMNLWKAEPKK